MTLPLSTPQPGHDSRRGFLRSAAALGGFALSAPLRALASSGDVPDPVARYLAEHTVPRATIDRFLDPEAKCWARFHPTYGYLLRDALLRDGVDGARTLGRYTPGGPRRQVNFSEADCRINTYGDSFTQGHQVSDGETWQEVLAAHFCEPIRNYGIGGFGVYQACLRMRDTESTDAGAPHVVLNIWGDDHHRSIYAWRWLSFPTEVLPSMTGVMFHANPWAHVRLDAASGSLVEMANACPTPESLYNLANPDWVIDRFGQDDVTHALVSVNTGVCADGEPMERLATIGGCDKLDFSNPTATRLTARRVLNEYAIRAGVQVVRAAHRSLQDQGKRLIVLLSHPSGSVHRHCEGTSAEASGEVDWHPPVFAEQLRAAGIPVVDSVEAHMRDFQQFRGSASDYVKRYYIGHYTPTGNHFFAYAVKDDLVDWLDPPPPAYAGLGDETLIRFQGYLPE